ncbi:MAG: hypothetical protein A2086_06445 [Spirochaetes bacterium GWD1_27_9]|nr:MAG: hypothetical protein A2Z98_01955 [Spirochaetes bacterium GWB1_27_13]OHD24991.1 MAG: hypothetical protein A2Y34_13500 [Spirochaetes bacterium GWC1_27_15]OHD36505.1 MAG: hypothetical protein A2086_06445 [Spirochaetes bacterium GWD1_27_9]
MIKDYIKLIRPKHWIKNFFVFAGLIFSLNLLHLGYIIKSLEAFAAFCLASSAVYILNDIFDKEKDRNHPIKNKRPIASGRISVPIALVLFVIFLGGSISLTLMLNIPTLIILVLYILMNFFYTIYLKHIVILDVMIIALGFVFRVMAGNFAIGVPSTNWILLTTLAISLFIGFGKRRHEILLIDKDPHTHRPVLGHYNVQLLDYMMIISVTLTIITYALYSIDVEVIKKFGTNKLIYSVPLVIFGVFRYMYIIFKKGGGGDPADIVARDKYIIIDVILYVLVIVGILYLKI